MFGPKKSEPRIGQSSAFFTYVKSSMFRSAKHGGTITVNESMTPVLGNNLNLGGGRVDNITVDKITINLTDESTTQYVHVEEKVSSFGEQKVRAQGYDYIQAHENIHSNHSFPDSVSVDKSSISPLAPEAETQDSGNNHHQDISGYNAYSAYPYYPSGPMNHFMINMNHLRLNSQNQQKAEH
uniref:uncharacterized protein LOC122601856 n=1 Tax=Erigeron canadensis TaxID=72917 RepID=UPI001CB912DC|nr:uncharacterized protein LOC122601856 [Erigeron canadensis]